MCIQVFIILLENKHVLKAVLKKDTDNYNLEKVFIIFIIMLTNSVIVSG